MTDHPYVTRYYSSDRARDDDFVKSGFPLTEEGAIRGASWRVFFGQYAFARVFDHEQSCIYTVRRSGIRLGRS